MWHWKRKLFWSSCTFPLTLLPLLASNVAFAFFGAFAAFGIGNMVQANTTAQAVTEILGINTVSVGMVLAVLTALVVLGGIRRIAEVTTILVPLMIIVYFTGALVILMRNLGHIGSGFRLIWDHAFNGTAATGGFAGATLARTIRYGVARGLFSNESGLGSAPIAAAAAKTNQPAKQGLVSMTGTFLDTLVICSLTAVVLTTTGVWTSGETGVALTLKAFTKAIPGVLGNFSSALEDSFHDGLLDCPWYTRPAQFHGSDVPTVLLSGDHDKVRVWRRHQALKRTFDRRPEILSHAELDPEERRLVEKWRHEKILQSELCVKSTADRQDNN